MGLTPRKLKHTKEREVLLKPIGSIKTGMAKLCAPYLLDMPLPRDWDISKLDNGGGIRVLGRRGWGGFNGLLYGFLKIHLKPKKESARPSASRARGISRSVYTESSDWYACHVIGPVITLQLMNIPWNKISSRDTLGCMLPRLLIIKNPH